MFKCACGKEYADRPGLTRHGLGRGNYKSSCPQYMERKNKCLPLNVSEKTKSSIQNQDQENILNKLKIDDVRAKIQISIPMRLEFFYLLIEREFIKSGESIYKIGKTIVLQRRFMRYPKGSEIILVVKVSNCDSFETQIKVLFKKAFVNRLDVGEEYFEGDVRAMKNIIYDLEKTM